MDNTLMLDLQEAFDTVNHSIPLQNFTAIFFDHNTTSWVKFYPSGRARVVS